ncbi:hypothetical protein GW17_00053130 [Ensete ventricosum]|nr:hypothetical protein GW17_00053130 [Ensete ventricosum]
MESSSPTVPFPLLQTPIESKYRVCTIPYRFPSDNPRKATPVEIQWIDLFLNSVPSFRFAFLAFPFDPWSPDLCILGNESRETSFWQAVIFVDNSGADIILGVLPFARELLRRGTTVYLVLFGNVFRSVVKSCYVKHPEVAQFLGGRLYDCVFKYHEVLNY